MANTYVEKIKEFPGKSWDYAKDNKGKTALGVGIALTLSAYIITYYFFPAYAAKVAALTITATAAISGGFASMFTFMAANPITFGLLAVAAVATLGVLAVKSYNQANQLSETQDIITRQDAQLGKIGEEVGKAFEKNDNGERVLTQDDAIVRTAMTSIEGVLPKVNQVGAGA